MRCPIANYIRILALSSHVRATADKRDIPREDLPRKILSDIPQITSGHGHGGHGLSPIISNILETAQITIVLFSYLSNFTTTMKTDIAIDIKHTKTKREFYHNIKANLIRTFDSFADSPTILQDLDEN